MSPQPLSARLPHGGNAVGNRRTRIWFFLADEPVKVLIDWDFALELVFIIIVFNLNLLF